MKNTNYKEYVIINYTDVWGNQEDGYEINNQEEVGSIFISTEMSESDIIVLMVELGYLTTENGVSISNTGDGWELEDAYNSYPLYGLVPVWER
jgi:hypothetical protein